MRKILFTLALLASLGLAEAAPAPLPTVAAVDMARELKPDLVIMAGRQEGQVPQKMTLFWLSLGRLRATSPMMRALSPASTRSIRTIASRADRNAAEKKSVSTKSLQQRVGVNHRPREGRRRFQSVVRT